MSELTQAMRLATGRGLGLHVSKWPSGRYGYVGSVPAHLYYDCSDEKILAEIAQSSFPAMACKHYGVKIRGFETEQAAREFAESKGFQVIS